MNTNKEKTLITLEKAERLYREVNSTENNCVYFDADSILYEYLTDVPMGLFEELCKGYRNCEDTDTFEALFYMLTGITFQEFLDRCVKETCVVASESAQSNPEPEIKLALMPNDEVWVLFRPNHKTETEQVEANAPPQICRSVVKEVIVSLDSKGTPCFAANLQVYPNCTDTDALEDKLFFYAQKVPAEKCYKTREAAIQALTAGKKENSRDEQRAKRVIDSFRGEYSFLSNFFPCPVTYKGKTYLCAEAAFQAQKCPARANEFTMLDASQAKRLGRQVRITVADWDDVRVNEMGKILWAKFLGNPKLARKLLKTGDAVLIEGNHWGDTFWGMCQGKGENNLGKLLMSIRKALKENLEGLS